MREDRSSPPDALRRLCEDAGQQAAGWASHGGGAPRAGDVIPWSSVASVVAACGLFALAALALPLLGEGDTAPTPPAPVQALPAVGSTWALPAAVEPVARVRWQGAELLIELDQVPLTEAVAQLASATHTAVNGAELLDASARVTLQLRTRDVDSAWLQLLRRHAAYSTSCSGTNCRLWIRGSLAVPAAAAPDDASASPDTEREPRSGVSREEMESQPDGAC